MHIASFHSFLVKKVRWLNSHQELSHKTDHHHAQGRKAKLSGRKEVFHSVMESQIAPGVNWLYLQPHTCIHYGKYRKAELRSKSLNSLGNLESAAANTGAGKTQRFTEMKGFRQPVAIGSHYKFKLFQNSPSPSHLVQRENHRGLCW